MKIGIPKDCLTKETSVAEVIDLWRGLAGYEDLLSRFEGFAKQIQMGDGLWWYQMGHLEGLAVVRGDVIVAEFSVGTVCFLEDVFERPPFKLRITWRNQLSSSQVIMFRKVVRSFYDLPISAVRLVLESRGFWELLVNTEDDAKMMEETCGSVGLTVTRV